MTCCRRKTASRAPQYHGGPAVSRGRNRSAAAPAAAGRLPANLPGNEVLADCAPSQCSPKRERESVEDSLSLSLAGKCGARCTDRERGPSEVRVIPGCARMASD